MPWAKTDKHNEQLVPDNGAELSRPVAFKFALEPSFEQSRQLFMCAGARRFAYNHHIARVKDNLSARNAEKEAGTEAHQMTPSLSWAAVSFINEFNAWKTGRLEYSPVAEDEARGLAWHHEVPADVFECTSVDAATALKNYRGPVTGARAGAKVGFPRFAAKHKQMPGSVLRGRHLRERTKPGAGCTVGPRGARPGRSSFARGYAVSLQWWAQPRSLRPTGRSADRGMQ